MNFGECEWNPKEERAARIGVDPGACTNPVTLRAGSGDRAYFLCAECAALPRFKFYKKHPLRRETP